MNKLVLDLEDCDVELLEKYRDMIKDNSEDLEELEELSSMIALMVVARLGSLERT